MNNQEHIAKKAFGGIERYKLTPDSLEIYSKKILNETSYSIPFSRISTPPIVSTSRNAAYLSLLLPALIVFLIPLILVIVGTHEKASTQACLTASAIGLFVVLSSIIVFALRKTTAYIYLDKETGLIAARFLIRKSNAQATEAFITSMEEKIANQGMDLTR